MTIDEALATYALQLQADGRSAHTRKQYERHMRLFSRWLGEREIESVMPTDVARFLVSDAATKDADGAPKKATTVNALRTTLRVVFGWMHAAGVIPTNPARLVRRARCGSAPPRALSDDQQRRLLDTLAAANGWEAERDHALFHLMLATGIRLASALGLDVDDVDLDRGELTLRRTKGNRVERVFLGARIRELLATFLNERSPGPVFVSRHGERLSPRQAQRRLAELAELAGIRRHVSPHQLRHSFAQGLYDRSRDLVLVQRALHHSSILSSVRYARASDEHLRVALGCGSVPRSHHLQVQSVNNH